MANVPYPGHVRTGQILSGQIDLRELASMGMAVGTAFDTITEGDALYASRTTPNYYARALATGTGTMPVIGVAMATAASGAGVRVMTAPGRKQYSGYNFSGFLGQEVYISPATRGALEVNTTTVSGNYVQVVGYVDTFDTVYFRPTMVLQRGGPLY